ncbi:CHC2 zinc finger domain-containing protein [Pedobacter sp. ASV28]|uniref:CHC2 zinc finger domain-containing protein n=1 Tax=Pedobacter sp. ASV28 TaxID=2795123 RepID=UPI0018EB76CB|nr:CHC2 zinc finger domain-containing protein [Pedobacter sp. ASV28]
MENIDWQQIRNIDLVHYLAQLGIEPKNIRGNDFWYHSPFREERTPSFKVNREKNVWYDWGEGKGGNLIDFAMRYHNCTVAEFLQGLKGTLLMQKPGSVKKTFVEEERAIKIVGERSIWSYALINYIKQRNIPLAIAEKYCREVLYTMKGKQYYGIGFKNDLGGFEIRNAHVKISSSPKGFTSIKNGAQNICVFEGFFDFLSFRTLHQHLPENSFDFMILNSLSFFERARPVMEQYQQRHLYLDQGKRGQEFTTYATSLSKSYIDESSLYRNHDDLNDFHCNFGKLQTPDSQLQQQKIKKPRKGL